MKNQFLFFIIFILGFAYNGISQTSSYETKFTVSEFKNVFTDNENVIVAGEKSYNVISTLDGKIVADKTYESTGAKIGKFDIAFFSASYSQLIFITKKTNTIVAIDVKTGIKTWEATSFTNLKNDGALALFDKYLLVSDLKAKKNNALICIDSKTGAVLWTIENEEKPIENLTYFGSNKYFLFYASSYKAQNLRFVNFETGKIEFKHEVSGLIASMYFNQATNELFVHHLVKEANSTLSCINLSEQKIKWASKSSNVCTMMSTPLLKAEYYSFISIHNSKLVLVSEGIEIFNLSDGKSISNLPYKPYVASGPGQYENGIFKPVIADNSIYFADGTKGDLLIKKADIETGKIIWSSEKFKNKEFAPLAFIDVDSKSLIIQFGGVCNFISQKNAGTTSVKSPCAIYSFDCESGKKNWNVDYKKDLYLSGIGKASVVAISEKEIQDIDIKSGAVLKTSQNKFDERIFVTKSAWVKIVNKSGRLFDFENRLYFSISEDSLIKRAF